MIDVKIDYDSDKNIITTQITNKNLWLKNKDKNFSDNDKTHHISFDTSSRHLNEILKYIEISLVHLLNDPQLGLVDDVRNVA